MWVCVINLSQIKKDRIWIWAELRLHKGEQSLNQVKEILECRVEQYKVVNKIDMVCGGMKERSWTYVSLKSIIFPI